jgi:hypothetical protein
MMRKGCEIQYKKIMWRVVDEGGGGGRSEVYPVLREMERDGMIGKLA